MTLSSQDRQLPSLPEYSDEASFSRDVIEDKSPTLVCFYARWCSFCDMFKPQFLRVAKETPSLRFAWVDISDWNSEMWTTYDIRAVPSLVLFRDGRAVDRVDGILGRGLKRHDLQAIIRRANGKIV